MRKYDRAILIVILNLSLVNPAWSATRCTDLISGSTQNSAPAATALAPELSDADTSYLRLLEASLKLNIITSNDVEQLIPRLETGVFSNPLEGKVLNAGSLPYKKIFDKLKLSATAPSEALLDETRRLIGLVRVAEETKANVREKSREIYSPHVASKIDFSRTIESSPEYNKSEDDTETLSFESTNNEFNRISIGKPDAPININIKSKKSKPRGDHKYYIEYTIKNDLVAAVATDGLLKIFDINNPDQEKKYLLDLLDSTILFKPKLITSRDNRELALVSSLDGSLFVVDYNSNQAPIKIDLGQEVYTTPEYFVTKSGRELVALINGQGEIILVDLKTKKVQKKKYEVGNSDASPLFVTTKDGRELLIIATQNESISIVDLNSKKKPVEISTVGVSRTTPTYIQTDDGNEWVGFGTDSDMLYMIDLNNSKNMIEYSIADQSDNTPLGQPLFVNIKEENKILAITPTEYGVYITDMLNPHSSARIELGFEVGATPTYFKNINGRHTLAAPTSAKKSTIFLIDLFDLPKEREVKP